MYNAPETATLTLLFDVTAFSYIDRAFFGMLAACTRRRNRRTDLNARSRPLDGGHYTAAILLTGAVILCGASAVAVLGVATTPALHG